MTLAGSFGLSLMTQLHLILGVGRAVVGAPQFWIHTWGLWRGALGFQEQLASGSVCSHLALGLTEPGLLSIYLLCLSRPPEGNGAGTHEKNLGGKPWAAQWVKPLRPAILV